MEKQKEKKMKQITLNSMPSKNYTRNRVFLYVMLMMGITLLSTIIVFAAPDVSGTLNSAGTELNTTLSGIPKAVKPIFYVLVALGALIKIGQLSKEWFEHKNDDREAKQITSSIFKTVGLAIGIAVMAPFAVKLINVLFGTTFQF